MVGSSLAPKWPILVPFCGMDHQKSNFSLILALFLSEAVEASRCYFFENWWMKLKCPLLLKPLATIVQENYQSFYPSEPFRIIHFTMRHPVVQLMHIKLSDLGYHVLEIQNLYSKTLKTGIKKRYAFLWKVLLKFTSMIFWLLLYWAINRLWLLL